MIQIVYGTRAELIKFSALIRELKIKKIKFKLIDTGDHDTKELRKLLLLPKPDYYFGKAPRELWTKFYSIFYPITLILALYWGAVAFFKLIKIFLKEGDIVIVHGNAKMVPVTTFATKILFFKNTKLIHYESGLRGRTLDSLVIDLFYKIADYFSDILLTPYKSCIKNLKLEKVNGKIIFTGDTLVDVINLVMKLQPKIKIPNEKYILMNSTLALRSRKRVSQVAEAIINSPIKILFFINPRIENRFKKYNFLNKIFNSRNIEIRRPINYIDFLHLLKNSAGVITDSNSVQEECAYFKKPCIVLNDFIQFLELQKFGYVKVTGCDSKEISKTLEEIKNKKGLYITAKNSKFSIGRPNSTKRIVEFLETIAL